jgi:hypothetical protein
MDLSPLRDPSKDVIESGALRLTWGSGVGAVIVGLGTAIDPVFDTVVGEDASPAVRGSILIAAIAAWAIIATGDLLARSYATAHAKKPGLSATLTRGVDETGFLAVDFRSLPSDPDAVEVLLVKAGKRPEWVSSDEVRFD